MPQSALAFVDLETTGTNARTDRIIEVGMVLVDADGSVEEWSTLVNPGTNIEPFIENMTGINTAMLREAPDFESVAEEILARLDDRLFIAHNARFDYGFLQQEFARLDITFTRNPLCTVKLSRKLFPAYTSHNLDAIIGRHGLQVEARHRALGDAQLLWQFYRVLQQQKSCEEIDAAIKAVRKRPSLPRQLSEQDIQRLPDRCGVYRFYDKAGALLYVGKSINIRSRVLSHFSADTRSQRAMRISQEVADIEFTETAGELGALLLEAREIKERMPIFNRRLRRSKRLFSFYLDVNSMERGMLQLVELDSATFNAHTNFYGLFRSRQVAKNRLRELARENGLCAMLLELEPAGKAPCFGHQLQHCRGACAGKESLLQHKLRLLEALEDLKVRTWPFDGRIGIRESSGSRTEIHILDNWCHLGTVADEGQLDLFRDGGRPMEFDLDVYRLLQRYLKKKAQRATIVSL